MTTRTTDYHCPRCRKYLFSAYTYPMTKAELIELDEEAAIVCKCAPSIDAATLNRTEGEKEEGNG